jgi:protein tyrosine phosphatase
MTKSRQAIDDAISAGNYDAFKTAIANLPKPANASGSTVQTPSIPTQDEFNKMVTQKKARESMKTAIESNDYNAFLAAWNANKPSVPSKDQFTKMTERVNKVVNNVSKKLQNGAKKVKRTLSSTSTQN